MDIETLLRLAKKQSQWNAFVSNIRRSTTPEELAKTAIETNNYTNFLENTFYWTGTKEGYAFWYKTTMNFCKVVRDYESSTPVFKAYEKKVLVARFVDWKDRRPEDIEKLKARLDKQDEQLAEYKKLVDRLLKDKELQDSSKEVLI